MNIKNQIARVIQRNLDIFDSKQNNYKNQDEFIRDVTDGEIYANFKKNETIGSNFSFTLFTDGISFCKKSSITVWPVLLVISSTIESFMPFSSCNRDDSSDDDF